jgi:hypothetical protein
MVRLGLLDHARIFHGQPGVFLATRSGLSIAELELPPARIDIRTYGHDLELSSVVIELEREFGPERVRTEREMRAADTDLGPPATKRQRFAVALSGARGQLQLTPAGHPRLHFPSSVPRARPPTECWPSSSNGLRKGGRGCVASSPHTSAPDTSLLCATTQPTSASDVSLEAKWQRSARIP